MIRICFFIFFPSQIASVLVLLNPPRRSLRPSSQGLCCPCTRLVCVAGDTRVRYFVLVTHRRCDEAKSVRPHIDARDGHFYFGHVTRNALASGAAILMVCVLGEGSGPWAVLRVRSVAVQANFIGRLSQLRVIFGAMNVMATEASNTAPVHHALHKVVTLHTIFM